MLLLTAVLAVAGLHAGSRGGDAARAALLPTFPPRSTTPPPTTTTPPATLPPTTDTAPPSTAAPDTTTVPDTTTAPIPTTAVAVTSSSTTGPPPPPRPSARSATTTLPRTASTLAGPVPTVGDAGPGGLFTPRPTELVLSPHAALPRSGSGPGLLPALVFGIPGAAGVAFALRQTLRSSGSRG